MANIEALRTLAVEYLHKSVRYDTCEANQRLVVDHLSKFDARTADLQRAFNELARTGVLVPNQRLVAALKEWRLTNPDYAGIAANEEQLTNLFLGGGYVCYSAMQDYFDTHKQQFARNQQAIDSDLSLKHAVNVGKTQAQEIIRLVAELMAPFKVYQGYVPRPGFISQKEYDAKEAAFTELGQQNLDALRQEHQRITELRALKSAPRTEKRTDDTTDVGRYKPKATEQNSPTYARYPQMPRTFCFPGETSHRELSGDLLLALQKNDFYGWWRVFVDRWGSEQVVGRIREYQAAQETK